MMDDKKEIICLGWANGWGSDTPEIVKNCESKGHHQEASNSGRCITIYRCRECGYYYRVDSSD